MKKLISLEYFIGFTVISGIFIFAYNVVSTQNASLSLDKDSLKGLKDVKVEICELRGKYISKKCRTLNKDSSLGVYRALLSSHTTHGPSKAKKISNDVYVFTGIIAPEKSIKICFVGTVFHSLPNKIYFSSFIGNRKCNEIVARQGRFLVTDLPKSLTLSYSETGSE